MRKLAAPWVCVNLLAASSMLDQLASVVLRMLGGCRRVEVRNRENFLTVIFPRSVFPKNMWSKKIVPKSCFFYLKKSSNFFLIIFYYILRRPKILRRLNYFGSLYDIWHQNASGSYILVIKRSCQHSNVKFGFPNQKSPMPSSRILAIQCMGLDWHSAYHFRLLVRKIRFPISEAPHAK